MSVDLLPNLCGSEAMILKLFISKLKLINSGSWVSFSKCQWVEDRFDVVKLIAVNFTEKQELRCYIWP